jgi:ABC-type nitrate/sulfonate/bicarbonate transport system permease component
VNAIGPRVALGAVLPLSLIAIWQAWGMAQPNPRVPLPTRVVDAAFAMTASGDLPMAILQSLGRVFAGFAIAALLAIPLGLAMGRSRAVERNVDPLVESFRPIAAIAILPVAILWLGNWTHVEFMIVI